MVCTPQVQAAQVQALGFSTEAQARSGLRFAPVPERGGPQVGAPPSAPPLVFLGVQRARLLRCAECLFWGAGLWPGRSRRMSTVQTPVESACSLVSDASLRPRAPLPALAALAGLPASGGDGPVRSGLAPLRPLFCEPAWRCLRLGLFVG